MELLQDPDLFTVTHALMALGNATRTPEDAIRVREVGEETGETASRDVSSSLTGL